MDCIKQNVGVEVDSKKLVVYFSVYHQDLSSKIIGSRKFDNSAAGFKAFKMWIDKKAKPNLDVHITLEATGVYYERLAYFFNEQSNFKVHVVLGNVSKAFIKSLNNKSKTDKTDAKALAQLGLERNLKLWIPASDQMRTLKKLVRERLRILKEKNMVSNQLHAEKAAYKPLTHIINRSDKRIEFLKKQINKIEKQILQFTKKDPELYNKIQNVCTAKGIAFITAISVVAELNGFILFNNRAQLVSYSGYDVVFNQSGSSINGPTRISKKGNAYIRQILYMPALSAARFDDHHKNYYQRIVNKTGIKLKGNVAIQRKLLLLIYALFTKNQPYDPNYHINLKNKIVPNYNYFLTEA